MDLSYENLWSSTEISKYMRDNMYREESNVFCYFVLAGIFMNDFDIFIHWCKMNNSSFIKFEKSHTSAKKFGDLINSLYNRDNLIANLKNVKEIDNKNKLLNTTGRMTCVEIKH